MTIDELQEHCERVCNPNGKIFFNDKSKTYQEHKLVLNIIEELKCYKNNNDFSEYADKLYETAYAKGFNDGCEKFSIGQDYDDGIDDFANKIVEINLLNCFQLYVADEIDLEELMILASEEISEQLKGVNNG